MIYGRSDATLNPGGVRIGTAEIYRQVEKLPEVVESVAVGQELGANAHGDVRIVLFVRLREGVLLDHDLRARIITQIRANTSPMHVPKVIVAVTDIPRTVSGKISEIAVREVIHGRPVKNTEALAIPLTGVVPRAGRAGPLAPFARAATFGDFSRMTPSLRIPLLVAALALLPGAQIAAQTSVAAPAASAADTAWHVAHTDTIGDLVMVRNRRAVVSGSPRVARSRRRR